METECIEEIFPNDDDCMRILVNNIDIWVINIFISALLLFIVFLLSFKK